MFNSIQNGKLYTGFIFSDKNSSALSLRGSTDEIGNYTCHWNNNLGQPRFKQFTVNHVDELESEGIAVTGTDTSIVAVVVSIVLAIILLIAIIVGVRFYLIKVNYTS